MSDSNMRFYDSSDQESTAILERVAEYFSDPYFRTSIADSKLHVETKIMHYYITVVPHFYHGIDYYRVYVSNMLKEDKTRSEILEAMCGASGDLPLFKVAPWGDSRAYSVYVDSLHHNVEEFLKFVQFYMFTAKQGMAAFLDYLYGDELEEEDEKEF